MHTDTVHVPDVCVRFLSFVLLLYFILSQIIGCAFDFEFDQFSSSLFEGLECFQHILNGSNFTSPNIFDVLETHKRAKIVLKKLLIHSIQLYVQNDFYVNYK